MNDLSHEHVGLGENEPSPSGVLGLWHLGCVTVASPAESGPRDVDALTRLADAHRLPAQLIAGVAASNNSHREWARRALLALLGAMLALMNP